MTAPVRLQLSLRKGFNLQALSIATNGLPAVSVARPSQYGNPWIVGPIACGCRTPWECTHNRFRCENVADAVDAHREWTMQWSETAKECMRAALRGRNLACWCRLDAPCHADVLLELANQ